MPSWAPSSHPPAPFAWATALTCVALASYPALAASPAETWIELAWEAPAECPTGAAVVAQIDAPKAQRTPPAPVVRARGKVMAVDGGNERYELRLAVRGALGQGERVVRADTCAHIAEAAALVLGVALEGELAAAPKDVPATPPVAVRTEAHAPHPTTLGLGIAGAFDAGSLPGASGGPAAALAIARPPWRAELHGLALLGRDARGLTEGSGATVRLYAAGARGCVGPVDTAWDPAACAGAEVGRMTGDGFGLRSTSTSAGTWIAATAGVFAGPALSRSIALRAGVEGGWVPLAPRFVVDGQGTVFEPPSLFLRASAGVEMRLL
jgi:hypothetical protein